MKSLLIVALYLAQSGSGWVDLFDGRTMKGWSPVGSALWDVVDGTLSANPSCSPRSPRPTARR